MINHPCGEFGDCKFRRFGFIVRTDTQTAADVRFAPATLIGVLKFNEIICYYLMSQ